MRNNRKSGHALGYVLVTAAVLCLCIYSVGRVVFTGPSEKLSTAAVQKFAGSTGAGLIPRIYLSRQEIADKLAPAATQAPEQQSGEENLESTEAQNTDPEQQQPELPAEPTPDPGPQPDAYGLIDEDRDGIIRETFRYKGTTVYAMVVLDPSRVFVGTAVQDPEQYGAGITLEDMLLTYDAIGGINAGGFIDNGGTGAGWPPDGITYGSGTCYNQEMSGEVAGLNGDNELFVGWYSYENCEALGIRDCVSFGPELIIGGVKCSEETLKSEINPRTAIGQRGDKAIVMIVADGRQAYSIGLTYGDCADILLDRYGCVTAMNMDGGNSSAMYFDGEVVNNPSNPAGGTRNLPTAWLIRK